MHPYLFKIPLPGGHRFPIASYGFMILCGYLLCVWLLRRRGRRIGLDPLALFDVAVVTLLGGIVGARLFYVIHHWEFFAKAPWQILFLHRGGLTFFGGLLGGGGCLVGGIWQKRLPVRATLDMVASLVPLGHAFGRMGCFLNGCCFGKITHSWVGMRFPRFPRILVEGAEITGSPVFLHHQAQGLVTAAAARSLPVHPTQLYAVGYNLVIFALLSYLLCRRRRAGEVAWLYPILYGTARYMNEFFRGDTTPLPALGGLTLFQAIAAAVVAFGVVMLADSRRRTVLKAEV